MSITPQQICENALKRFGALAAGDTPDPQVMADVFARLNSIVDLWATQRLTINGVQKFSLPVVAGHNPYTIGPTGDFAQARPVWLPYATITLATTIPTDISFTMVDAQTYWQGIASKSTQSQINTLAYFDNAAPNGNLYVWPVLNDPTVTLNIFVPVAIVQFTSLTQALDLLPGYQSALEYNLADDILPEFGRTTDPIIVQKIQDKAQETLGWIKRANLEVPTMSVDPGMLPESQISNGPGNWYVGP